MHMLWYMFCVGAYVFHHVRGWGAGVCTQVWPYFQPAAAAAHDATDRRRPDVAMAMTAQNRCHIPHILAYFQHSEAHIAVLSTSFSLTRKYEHVRTQLIPPSRALWLRCWRCFWGDAPFRAMLRCRKGTLLLYNTIQQHLRVRLHAEAADEEVSFKKTKEKKRNMSTSASFDMC